MIWRAKAAHGKSLEIGALDDSAIQGAYNNEDLRYFPRVCPAGEACEGTNFLQNKIRTEWKGKENKTKANTYQNEAIQ